MLGFVCHLKIFDLSKRHEASQKGRKKTHKFSVFEIPPKAVKLDLPPKPPSNKKEDDMRLNVQKLEERRAKE